MARVVVVTHEFDVFASRRRFYRSYRNSPYLLFDVLKALEQMGHSWHVMRGPGKKVHGDVGILHTDCTIASDEYLALARNFRVPLNFNVRDISKRFVSGAVLSENEDWRGPVIIKSNLNCGGASERRHNDDARREGRALPYPNVGLVERYTILPSRNEVPVSIWADPGLVVEKFVPEREKDGYAVRTWVFMGENERCTRHVSTEQIVKAAGVTSRTASPVPDEIRAERKRLGFDFGKFDFVIYDGEPILLDANRTPGISATLREFLQAGARNLAEGLDKLISSRV